MGTDRATVRHSSTMRRAIGARTPSVEVPPLGALHQYPHAARRTGFCVMGECRKRTESGWCSTCGAGSIARIFPALIVQLPELCVANIFHRKVVQALLLQWGRDH